MKARLALIAIVSLALAAPADTHAAPNVSVKLRVANLTYLQPTAICTVSVPQGSDGIAVLTTAQSTGCIQSFTLVYYGLGAFVDCINGTCTQPQPPYRYWAMRESLRTSGIRSPLCMSTDYGVNDFYADQGDELSFTYETLATGMLPGVCPA